MTHEHLQRTAAGGLSDFAPFEIDSEVQLMSIYMRLEVAGIRTVAALSENFVLFSRRFSRLILLFSGRLSLCWESGNLRRSSDIQS